MAGTWRRPRKVSKRSLFEKKRPLLAWLCAWGMAELLGGGTLPELPCAAEITMQMPGILGSAADMTKR